MDMDDIDFTGQQVLCLAAQTGDKSGGRGNSTPLLLVLILSAIVKYNRSQKLELVLK